MTFEQVKRRLSEIEANRSEKLKVAFLRDDGWFEIKNGDWSPIPDERLDEYNIKFQNGEWLFL